MEMRIIDTHCDTIGECIARSQGKITLQNNPGHINVGKAAKRRGAGGILRHFRSRPTKARPRPAST